MRGAFGGGGDGKNIGCCLTAEMVPLNADKYGGIAALPPGARNDRNPEDFRGNSRPGRMGSMPSRASSTQGRWERKSLGGPQNRSPIVDSGQWR